MLVRLILRRATAGGLLWAGFGLTSLLYAACYKSIAGALGACRRRRLGVPGPGWLGPRAPSQRPPAAAHPAARATAARQPHPPPPTNQPPARAAPVYGERGELIFAGQDLSLGGALSYFHDSAFGAWCLWCL